MSDNNFEVTPEEELFSAFLEEDLPPEKMAEFRQRLDGDEEFRTSFERYRRAVELLREVGPARAPDSLLPSLQRRVAGRDPRGLGPYLRFPYELLVFMVLLAGILYVYFAMVPTPPRAITRRENPVLITLSVTRAPPPALVERFQLHQRPVGPEGPQLVSPRLDRDRATQLLDALSTHADSLPSLPDHGNLFRVVIPLPRR